MGDAEQLISEAVKLLKDASSVVRADGHREERVSSVYQAGEDDNNIEDKIMTATTVMDELERTDREVEKDETDQSKDSSPEQSFWSKLAKQSF